MPNNSPTEETPATPRASLSLCSLVLYCGNPQRSLCSSGFPQSEGLSLPFFSTVEIGWPGWHNPCTSGHVLSLRQCTLEVYAWDVCILLPCLQSVLALNVGCGPRHIFPAYTTSQLHCCRRYMVCFKHAGYPAYKTVLGYLNFLSCVYSMALVHRNPDMEL